MRKLLPYLLLAIMIPALLGCNGDCTYCRFPPFATITYDYTLDGQTYTGETQANGSGCISAPCNADNNSFEILLQ